MNVVVRPKGHSDLLRHFDEEPHRGKYATLFYPRTSATLLLISSCSAIRDLSFPACKSILGT